MPIRIVRLETPWPEASLDLELLAALSYTSSFSAGCYCVDASHCHRSILRTLPAERGASVA